ncbi:MAG: hypothetical protein IK095_05045 [Oscillospiraceae bacterium]|nr:hypothetical protein [Oscillospiraceae bacterium]
MSVDKLVDSTQLDADLTSVADAIRAKSGGSTQLAFPAGFVSEIQAIPGGGDEVFFSTQGYMYVEEIDFPATVTDLKMNFYNTGGYSHVKSISGMAQTTTGAPGNQFRGLSDLETVHLPRACRFYSYAFRACTKLKTVELGSIGYPVVYMADASHNVFYGVTQSGLTITLYVNASTLAEAQAISDVGALAPWGATNATIVYRSSTTGEVLV